MRAPRFAAPLAIAALALVALVGSPDGWAGPAKTPNPGLSGVITYGYKYPTRNSNVMEVDLTSGVARNRFVGYGGRRNKNGETVYLNPNGVIVIGKPDTTTAARIEAEVAVGGSPGYTYNADVTRYTAALSPDGSKVAYSLHDPINYDRVLVRSRAGTILAEFKGMGDPSWTPDGRVLMAGSEQNYNTPGIYLSDASLKGVKRLDPGLDNPDSPAASPDGKTVAFRFNQQVWLMGLDGSKLRQLESVNATFRDTRVQGYPTWSPDGKWIASVAGIGNSDDYFIFVQSVSNDPKLLQLVGGPDRYAIAVSVNPLSWR